MVRSPVIHLPLVQHMMAIADNGVENLLPAEHFCLEQLQEHIIIVIMKLRGQSQSLVHMCFQHFSDLMVSLLLQQTLVVA